MNKRVLLVDDEVVFNYIHRQLIDRIGFPTEIDEALNAPDAFQLIEERYRSNGALYDVIFIDLKMPFTDGVEFIRMYKNSPMYSPNTRIVVLSVHIESKTYKNIQELGIKDILFKPVCLDELKKVFMPGKKNVLVHSGTEA